MNQDIKDILLFHLWFKSIYEAEYKKFYDEFEEVLRS